MPITLDTTHPGSRWIEIASTDIHDVEEVIYFTTGFDRDEVGHGTTKLIDRERGIVVLLTDHFRGENGSRKKGVYLVIRIKDGNQLAPYILENMVTIDRPLEDHVEWLDKVGLISEPA